ncbi:MAG: class I SAM-dependent methyltransferase [Bacteroidota bacterium]|nr:class I SAM-dependent methyltransferase [Bacteroidota bacterium]
MDRKYWEQIAPGYNEEIFDVLHNDKKALIRSAITKIASRSKTVLDAGCAVGKWLPVLSPAFKKVIAADISAKNLAIAKKNYNQYGNVEYLRTDMSGRNIQLPKCDVAVCINAILTPSLKKRNTFFKNLSSCLKKGGYLILVVPSFESWLMTRIIQDRWKIDKKLFLENLSGKEAIKRYKNIQLGYAEIDNVYTKHYLLEELELLLSAEGFLLQDNKKIEYSWATEFIHPPNWLGKPYPWDWMIVARKK